MNNIDFHKTVFGLFVLGVAGWVFQHSLFLSGVNAYNQYPFLSSDGIDWVFQGGFLWESMKAGEFLGTLPVLRPPTYVTLTMLDAAMGGTGFVLGAVSALSVLFTTYYVIRFVAMTRPNLLVYAGVFIILMVSPINFFRLYYQADPLAVTLCLAAGWHSYKYVLKDGHRRDGLLAMLLTLVGGLTQTYGLIPPFMVLAYYGSTRVLIPRTEALKVDGLGPVVTRIFKEDFLAVIKVAWPIVAGAILMLIVRIIWVGTIPHAETPVNFGYLEFTFNMLPFYAQTWAYYLSPILFILATTAMFKAGRAAWREDELVQLLALIVVTFMTLLFFYQWQDARFTSYFWVFLVALAFRIIILVMPEKPVSAGLISLVAAIAIYQQAFVYYPQSYNAPRFDALNLTAEKKRDPFIERFYKGTPGDRLHLEDHCQSFETICEGVPIPPGSTSYRTKIHGAYLGLYAEKPNVSAPGE